MAHIRLRHFRDEQRRIQGRGHELPARNRAQHGNALRRELQTAIREYEHRVQQRAADLPAIPESMQVVLRSATTASGKPLLTRDDLPKGWKLEVIEERRDGALVTLSKEAAPEKLEDAIENFRQNRRTQSGRMKPGTRAVFTLEDIESTSRVFRIGDELALTALEPNTRYIVDVEIAAGNEQEEGVDRREQFRAYLRIGDAQIIGNGPLIGPDYAIFRVRARGTLVSDMLDVHPFVTFVDLPPRVEREGAELRDIAEPDLPNIEVPADNEPVIGVIDSGIIPEQPLIRAATAGQQHQSFISDSILDEGVQGHGTAVVSLVGLGSLREALLRNAERFHPVRVVLARVLDANTQIPENFAIHDHLQNIVRRLFELHECRIFNHSITSRAPFNRNRQTVWAEQIDRISYDEGGDGFLFLVSTGNIDGSITPTIQQVREWLNQPGHPDYLLEDRCRLRNPAQAINALTVGAYVPAAAANFQQAQAFGLQSISPDGSASPFTRSGLGYLGEIKPDIVEEGGNWYTDERGDIRTRPQHSDVAVANSAFARDGHLVKFSAGTSFAAARIAHLAGRILSEVPYASVDLVRALIVNSTEWPNRLASVEGTTRIYGYGVPVSARALVAEGPRSVIVIQDEIEVGHAQFFRIPFPRDMFEADPELMIRVSKTLAYRAPVRKTNLKYRGTILEWRFSQRGETLDQFRRRCATIRPEEEEDGADEVPEEEPLGDWNWNIGTRRRTRGTVQKDWFEAPADHFPDELYFGVIARRGWLSRERQAGFLQRYAVVVSIEVVGAVIPIHERIEEMIRVPIGVQR